MEMENIDKIFSTRIVSVDFYLKKPIKDFDICYSKFRGAPIKKVPLIRLFGSTFDGHKVCCHIHGTFPYIYIPFDAVLEGTAENFLYQLAASLDKAINISQGQTNSTNQHVVNIQIVRGIPIYGYHAHEHQFLKVYFLNPSIVHRAANLLQNGAILGKVYQPLESHVPYVLQFFIDFNLYGMSFLHVPKESVVYRSDNTLVKHLKKVSTCDIEIDIFATTILNAKTNFDASEQYSNPGIRSLWIDERVRRANYPFEPNDKAVPLGPLLHSGNRENKPTDSDLFYRQGLTIKLDQSKPDSKPKHMKKKFDLSMILANAVYPAECSLEHITSLDISTALLSENSNTNISEKRQPPQILVDESMALSATQTSMNNSFKAEDADLLAIMNELERTKENTNIEEDSLLGGLTQSHRNTIIIGDDDIAYKNIFQNSESDQEEEETMNFTLPLVDKYLENSESSIQSTIAYVEKPDTKTKVIEPEHTDCTPSNRVKTLAELKDIQILKLSSVELNDELINEILEKPPQLCIQKITDWEIENLENKSEPQRILPETNITIQNIKPPETYGCIDEHVVITLLCCPPDPYNIDKHLINYNIPDTAQQNVFFSDIEDLSGKQEIGHIVLQILSNKLVHISTHASLLPELRTIEHIRKGLICKFNNKNKSSHTSINEKNLKSFVSDNSECLIVPCQKPPTIDDAIFWCKSKERVPDAEKPIPQPAYEDKKNSQANHTVQQQSNYGNISFSGNHKRTNCQVFRKCRSLIDTSFVQYSENRKLMNSNTPIGNINSKLTKHEKRYQKKMEELSGSNDSMNLTVSQNDKKTNQRRSLTSSQKKDGTNNVGNLRKGLMKQTIHKSFRKFMNLDGPSSGELTCVSLENSHGFKMNLENLQTTKANIENNYLTVLSVEVHVITRGQLNPDPAVDPIAGVFYSIYNDVPTSSNEPINDNGMIVNMEMLMCARDFQNSNQKGFHVTLAANEVEIFEKLYQLVLLWNPDILAGYEIEMNSWGYLLQRAAEIAVDLNKMLSRIPSEKTDVRIDNGDEREHGEFAEFNTDIKITGRILLDIWRLLRHEIALTSYTFENCSFHILHQRYPLYSHEHLTSIWQNVHTIDVVIDYFMVRAVGNLEFLKNLDLVGRTSELAKLFGIQFYEVLSRGSQFRVESMMLRIAKPRNLVSVSPSVNQRAHMRAPEHIPLILEPESRMYVDPLIVLDFQSLYPSIIIAYNYCFSTCLGRVEHLGSIQPFEFGASRLRVPPDIIKQYLTNDQLTVSPCGVVFVKSSVREGVLPRMLEEILETRLMVKQSMKLYKGDSALQRVLHSRQLGLKLIANVTYGYTAANFSGRMPCVEVGDSVVSKGKETLERAIKLVEDNGQWRAKVVYGDTDSLFVLVPGRSRDEAFRIGDEIAQAVTNANPTPIKLKLEKIYQPSILQTKKRYVGYMFEHKEQKEPKYEAKGIETVRRDGVPAVGKMLEKTIRILFETKDVSAVKHYACRQFEKILCGKINIKDLIFAREFRGLNGYKAGACVPALELTRKWLKVDKRAEPRRGERVPYVIVNGAAGLPLIKLVRSPHELLHNDSLRINAIYYITKAIIPPLNRCLFLIGVNANDWFDKLPRKSQELIYHAGNLDTVISNWIVNKKCTVAQYFSTVKCAAKCDNETMNGLCENCRNSPQQTIIELMSKVNKADRQLHTVKKICQTCSNRLDNIVCKSLDCPVLFVVDQVEKKYKNTSILRGLCNDTFS